MTAGFNHSALATAGIDNVAALPRAKMAALSNTFRVTSTDGKKLYFTGGAYYLTDSHPTTYAGQAELDGRLGHGPTSAPTRCVSR